MDNDNDMMDNVKREDKVAESIKIVSCLSMDIRPNSMVKAPKTDFQDMNIGKFNLLVNVNVK